MAPLLHLEETMLQFTYKLKLTERVKAKCSRHPREESRRRNRGTSLASLQLR